jgi:hypothetical protein
MTGLFATLLVLQGFAGGLHMLAIKQYFNEENKTNAKRMVNKTKYHNHNTSSSCSSSSKIPPSGVLLS